MNGAESVVRSLHAGGVDVCFANPGTSEMHFVDALDRTGLMRCVLGLFEGVVSGAADGYARMAGKPAVTLLHLAPGFSNAGANLHNARKARSPIINLVGDHAQRHLAYDAPLTADVAGAAAPFSDWVHTATSSSTIGADAARAFTVATGKPNKIATLVAPADTVWDDGGMVAEPQVPAPPTSVDGAMLDDALHAIEGGRTVILAGGSILESERALALLSGIAAGTGATVLTPLSNRRMERGKGCANFAKVPYPVDMALELMRPFEHCLLIEAVEPIAFFAYMNKPSQILPEGCERITLAGVDGDGCAAVEALADRVGAKPHIHEVKAIAGPQRGPINAEGFAAAVVAAMPDNAIVCDESITMGRALHGLTMTAPRHSWIALTGGAIGIGPPLALGAAIACPDRPVLSLQADGSAMYTIQALWTQAREGVNVTTVILANKGYEILKGELINVGANPGRGALDMLEVDRPTLDFVSMARGMGVPATRVETVEALIHEIKTATAEPGPTLIEAAVA
ncbi:MAG: acetolactate synthase large subunit [Pseudomonadota bacterium]